MKGMPMISLKLRLILTYGVFISLALAVLTIIINYFFGRIFSDLIRDNIREKNSEIVQIISEQYNPLSGGFDSLSLEALGMHFVHEGYIVTVLDRRGNRVWDARSCDMQQCMDIIGEITGRMEKEIRLDGAFQNQSYPLTYRGRAVGSVSIETYGPFFYNETEFRFLASMNRLLFIAGLVFICLSAAVSVFLAAALSRPILRASEAARRIAGEHAGGRADGSPSIRIRDSYKTRELHELSRSINELARELEEGERRQRRLTADVAHELRTPLACLRGNVEAMIDGVWEPTAERLASCREEILRLSSLVEDLGLLTSLEWENLEPDKSDVDIKKLLGSAAEQFLPAAAEKGIAIKLDLEDGVFRADYRRLKQVFINLLANAVQYTDRGTITVTARRRAAAGEEPRWEFTVADTGIGIPPEDLPHVFERFYRSDKSRSRRTGGSGIGLTIAAAIVKAHGGEITAESGNGEGSVFRVVV
ncbi:MAG: HAMP domain-containing histidine kinase [Treponema sp.]|jgi:signal transduction histidine kinase|nr:HAMP domain-containing histidine kinase [Treponema sp.]